mmetsp:Transcript_21616/g.24124  ORF Transcript_21616/g.24124 Transcript_21616/m.24124 type:complete len:476 (+) Transcript_21616:34-1461(+)
MKRARIIDLTGDSDDELEQPPLKRKKIVVTPSKPSFEMPSCPICYLDYTKTGAVVPTALKCCGHVFCVNCITAELSGRKKCPLCSKKFKKSDILRLYIDKAVVVDNEERERLQAELNKQRVQKQQAEKKCTNLQRQVDKLKQTVENLKRQKTALINDPRIRPHNIQLPPSTFIDNNIEPSVVGIKKTITYKKIASIPMNPMGADKTLALDSLKHVAHVGIHSRDGFGYKKVSMLAPTHTQNVLFANRIITDMKMSTDGGKYTLCSSLDHHVYIIDNEFNQPVLNYTPHLIAYSCAWSSTDENIFYTGASTGTLFKFDMRMTKQPISSQRTHLKTKIHSMIHTKNGLILACQGGIELLDKNDKSVDVIYRGTCNSVCYDQHSNLLMAGYVGMGNAQLSISNVGQTSIKSLYDIDTTSRNLSGSNSIFRIEDHNFAIVGENSGVSIRRLDPYASSNDNKPIFFPPCAYSLRNFCFAF